MKYGLFIFLILAVGVASGQKKKVHQSKKTDVATHIWKVYDSLQKTGASTIISVERSFFGMRILDSLGGPDLYFDVFWQNKGITYFQEIKYYSDWVTRNPARVINNSSLFTQLQADFDSIKNEEFLPFIARSEKNGIAYFVPVSGIHKTNYDIMFLTKDEHFIQSFEASYLRENIGPDILNLNYRHNNSTRLMVLWKQLWDIIKAE